MKEVIEKKVGLVPDMQSKDALAALARNVTESISPCFARSAGAKAFSTPG